MKSSNDNLMTIIYSKRYCKLSKIKVKKIFSNNLIKTILFSMK